MKKKKHKQMYFTCLNHFLTCRWRLIVFFLLIFWQETVFNPYALKCGHIFCKVCACSAASVMIFQGVKAAPQCSKCPICREVCLDSCNTKYIFFSQVLFPLSILRCWLLHVLCRLEFMRKQFTWSSSTFC